MTDVVDYNQINTQKKFTGFSEGTDYEQAKTEAFADARAQAQAEIGPTVQYVSFDTENTRVDTGPNGRLIYRVTATVTAAPSPTSVPTPLNSVEQENVENPPAPVDTFVPQEPDPTAAPSLVDDAADNFVPQEPDPTATSSLVDDAADNFVPQEPNPIATPAPITGTVQTVSSVTQQSSLAYKQELVDNPLLEYENYTYSLSLHLLGIQQYNNIVNDDSFGKTYVPQNVLISSAGRYGNAFQRDPAFTEDFYFEDLKIKTIVNATARNRNSNLVECSFTVIEPLGFTLINRMLDAANRVNRGAGNYLQMPYLLQIDFFASTNGEIGQVGTTAGNSYFDTGPLKEHTKVLPILITNIKSRITARGTEYAIDAVAYNHQAFNQMHVSLPISTNVTATKVKDIFGSSAETSEDLSFYVKLSGKYSTEREAAGLRQYISQATGPMEADAATERLSTLTARLASQYSNFGITGFCYALNSYFNLLKAQNQISQVNTVRVVFDEEIGNADLFPQSGPVNAASTPTSGTTTDAQRAGVQSAAGRPTSQLNFNGCTLNIPAGTTIDRLIDWVVRNSAYTGWQINDPTLDPKNVNKGPLKWFKIVPKILIKEFDPIQNRYALDIIFYVKKFLVSAKHPFAPRGKVPGWVKYYNYMYTGKNRDVIDLQIDFNTLFLVEMQSARNKARYTQTGTPGEGVIRPTQPAPWSADLNDPTQVGPPTQNAFPVSTVTIADNAATMNRMGGNTQDSVTAGDLYRSLMLSAKGDMVQVQLKILGDPHFIKQDDVFFGQSLLSPSGMFVKSGNSLYMDGGELYVFVNFRSPVDYDESTGIANPTNNKYSYSEFSGVYKIITIDSVFSKGKFTQTLTLAKLLYDQSGQPLNSVTERAETAISQALTPIASPVTARFSGPRINLAAINPNSNAALALAIAQNPAGAAQAAGNFLTQVGVQAASAIINKVVGDAVNKGISVIDRAFTSPTFSTNPDDYTIFNSTASNYGAFGEDPTVSVTDAVAVPVTDDASGFLTDTAAPYIDQNVDVASIIEADALADVALADFDFGFGDSFNVDTLLG